MPAPLLVWTFRQLAIFGHCMSALRQQPKKRDVLEEVQAGTTDHPFHAVFIAHSQSLPYLLLVLGLAGDRYPGAAAFLPGVLGDFTKLNSQRSPSTLQYP